MPLYIPASPTDTVVALVFLLAQWALVRYLIRDAKPRMSRAFWWTVMAVLCLIWAASGLAMVLQVFQYNSRIVPVIWVRTLAVAVEMAWGMLSAYGSVVYWAYLKVASSSEEPFSPSRRTALKTSAVAVAAAPVIAMGYGSLIERTKFHVKEVDLPVVGLHPDLVGLKIVQISDLHVSAYLSVSDAARVVDMANELRADLAVITGDIISSWGDPLEASIRELGRLRAPAGILGCHGNHEIYARCQNLATRLGRAHGIDFLRQDARALRFGNGVLNVSGVDFQSVSRRSQYLRDTEDLIVPGATNLLLSHSPDVFGTAAGKGFQAVLSGHTHAGQVTVEILNQTANLARFYTPWVAGLYRLSESTCYVTAGIGTIGLPVRLGAPPEITLVRLRPA